MIDLYFKYNVDKGYTSIGLFREIKKKYNPKKVIYPGCYVHITPSLIFSDVTYVDSFRNTYKFYESEEVRVFIEENKEYSEKPKYRFYQQDYSKKIPEKPGSFDLAISQYGGFAGQAAKTYLQKGGILVCNNSHGDASMSALDADYKLTSVYNRKSDDKFVISDKALDTYLIPKRDEEITAAMLKKRMKGIAYTKSPSGYIFMKV